MILKEEISVTLTAEEIDLIRDALSNEMIRKTANGQQEKGDQCFDLRDRLYDYYFELITRGENNENK